MSPSRVVVLLEGRSDVAAVRALLRRQPVPVAAEQLDLVDMGGVTNVRRHLADLLLRTPGDPADGTDRADRADRADGGPAPTRVLGMCDAGEVAFFARGLASVGHPTTSVRQMASLGFHVCDRDLEDELLRALGPERVLEVLDTLGLLDRFATFRRQPGWAGRPVTDQLHRFAGTTSGRKAVVAEALTTACPPDRVPPPLAALVAQVVQAGSDRRPGPAVRSFDAAA